jgi:pyroglutamyl-peptidase
MRQSAERLLSLIEQHNPDVVICLGQAEGRTAITPERVAINSR